MPVSLVSTCKCNTNLEMHFVTKPPESAKSSLRLRLVTRARNRWPAQAEVDVRFRGQFAYVDGHLADGTMLLLGRLR